MPFTAVVTTSAGEPMAERLETLTLSPSKAALRLRGGYTRTPLYSHEIALEMYNHI